jgi:hypothetical protein
MRQVSRPLNVPFTSCTFALLPFKKIVKSMMVCCVMVSGKLSLAPFWYVIVAS